MPQPFRTGAYPLSPEAIEAVHRASLKLLDTTGMWVGSPELLATARDHGLRCDHERIRFDEEAVELAVSRAGKQFTLLAMDPAKTVTFRRECSLIGMGRSAPFISLPGGNRRSACASDYIEFIKLGQILDAISLPGQLAFPAEIPADRVYPFMMANQILYTDKPYCLLHPSDIEMLCTAYGIDATTLAAGPDSGRAWAQTTVNIQSPLALTREQGDYLLIMARHGIPMAISPTPAAGSTGPCSLAGNLVLNNSEILGTLVLIQLVRPGLPVFYSTFPCGSDMKSMMATFGGPETRKMEVGAAMLADRYGLLTRGNVALTDAHELDFQAGAESLFNVVSALQTGINFLPGCGISAGFASASREKLILDVELVDAARFFLEPIQVDELSEVLSLIQETGPKGTFITAAHTFASFRKELYHPSIFTRVSNERWLSKNETLAQLASQRADQLLKTYAQPELDPQLVKFLKGFF
jgi:trimethylamine--corrinoid protein Co-methyltransferase